MKLNEFLSQLDFGVDDSSYNACKASQYLPVSRKLITVKRIYQKIDRNCSFILFIITVTGHILPILAIFLQSSYMFSSTNLHNSRRFFQFFHIFLCRLD